CLEHLNPEEGSIAQPYITQHRIGAGTCPHPWEPAVWILRCPTVIHIFLSRSAKAVVGSVHQYRIAFLTIQPAKSLANSLAQKVEVPLSVPQIKRDGVVHMGERIT